MKLVDFDISVSELLKPKFSFDLLSLAERGQLTLLQISDKFGVVFFAFGPELIVVQNSELNQVLMEGTFPEGSLMARTSNRTHSNPIAFLKVSDKTD